MRGSIEVIAAFLPELRHTLFVAGHGGLLKGQGIGGGVHPAQQPLAQRRIQDQKRTNEVCGHQAAAAVALQRRVGVPAYAAGDAEPAVPLRRIIAVAEQAFEAHHVHVLERAQEEAVVALHHLVTGAAGQEAQTLNGPSIPQSPRQLLTTSTAAVVVSIVYLFHFIGV